MEHDTQQAIEITGIVLPSDWGDNDQLIEVVLYGNDESEHVIRKQGLGWEFLKLSHYRVRATGHEQVLQGRKVLDVTGYEILGTGHDSGYDLDCGQGPGA